MSNPFNFSINFDVVCQTNNDDIGQKGTIITAGNRRNPIPDVIPFNPLFKVFFFLIQIVQPYYD